MLRDRAGPVRQRLHATGARDVPQVMVKVTCGGRGLAAIVAHLRYISKSGRLPIEDDRGAVRQCLVILLARCPMIVFIMRVRCAS